MALRQSILFPALGLVALACTGALAQDASIYSRQDRVHPVWAASGMVASQEAVATEIGVEVLEGRRQCRGCGRRGRLRARRHPAAAGNLGGGGFMIVHDAETGENVAIDYREKAPSGASRDMFLDAAGEADPEKSRWSGLATGVPGYGRRPGARRSNATARCRSPTRSRPAIRLAEDGIVVTPDLSDSLKANARGAEGLAELGRDLLQGRRRRLRAGRTPHAAGSRGIAPRRSPSGGVDGVLQGRDRRA